MPHHFTDIALFMLLASLAAVLLSKLKQQPIVGYVIAGIIIGPAVLGVIHNEEEIRFIAELGVILLLFMLGMEMPLKSFRNAYKVAVPATFGLIGLSMALTFFVGMFIDLTLGEKIAYSFIISLSSTAVAVKLLDETNLIARGSGQIAISILIAQDLLFVPMMMTVNAMGAENGFEPTFLLRIAAAVGILIALIIFLTKKQKVHLLFHQTVEKHKDLIPVAALAWCFVGAGLSELSGLSPAYGAFLAGLIIGNSHSKDKILYKIEPMQSVLIMVFFMSIGMLIDFKVIMNNFWLIFFLLFGTMIFKTAVCIALLRLFLPEDRWRCSFVSGLTIAQIGEFSFIIAATALANGIFDNESYKITIAVIALSLSLSPLWTALLDRFIEITYVQKTGKTLISSTMMALGRRSQTEAQQ